jgi:DNA-binding MarR family transcriptional regulator
MERRAYDPVEVARAARRLDLALAEMHIDVARRMDMTQTELLAVAHLAVDEHLSPTDLARRLHLRSGAITALLDRLTAHGHIVREPHPSDRRRLVVSLTPSGRREAMRHLGPMVASVVAMVKRLPPTDRATVGRFIDDLAELVASRPKADDGADGGAAAGDAVPAPG